MMKLPRWIPAGLAALIVALAGGSLFTQPASAAVLATISQPTANNSPVFLFNAGQSFTATATGVVTTIRVAPNLNTTGTFSIRQGAGSGGTLLHQQSVSYSILDGAFQTITLSTPVPVTSGSVYTFYMGVGSFVWASSSNPYGGGNLYDGSGPDDIHDLKFEVVIEDTQDPCATGQLNCGQGDSYVQVHSKSDSSGSPALQFWCIDASARGVLAGVVTQSDFNHVAEKPLFNNKIRVFGSFEGCRVPVSVWVLTTGEYQIVIGPDAKGDVLRLIFRGLPPKGMYAKKCNILTSYDQCDL